MITYRESRDFTATDLQELFESVNWISAKFPLRLKKALDQCETVYTAWDDGRLVGLVNAIDDGELTAYIHYLCVNPQYQKQGIGETLLNQMKDHYSGYLYLLIIAENESLIGYYEKNGFVREKGTTVFARIADNQ